MTRCPECGSDGRSDSCDARCRTQTNQTAQLGRTFQAEQDAVIPDKYTRPERAGEPQVSVTVVCGRPPPMQTQTCSDCGGVCDGGVTPGRHAPHYRGLVVVNCVGKEMSL